MQQEFYSPAQIAKMLGISTYTVQELCRSGKMHHTRSGASDSHQARMGGESL